MGTKTYFSNRVYKNKIAVTYVNAITDVLVNFNRAKHFAFDTSTKEKRSGHSKRNKSIHLTVKERFGLDDYYANSAVQEAKAKQKSLQELNKLYKTNKQAQIQAVKTKQKQVKSRLTTVKKMKASFVMGKPTFPKNTKEQKQGKRFVVKYRKRTDIYDHPYQFEHSYLEPEIKRLEARLGFLTFKRHKLEQDLQRLQTIIPSVVFGTKRLFQSQYTNDKYMDDRQQWLNKWKQARYHTMTISGRKDGSSGNFVFHYHPEHRTLHFKTPEGKEIEIPNLHFSYGQEKVKAAMATQNQCKNKKKDGQPIAWSIEDHGDYYIFKCIIREKDKKYRNFSKSDGVIGIDCNVDHFAISNINGKGQLVSSWTQTFDIFGKTSGQITKIIEAEAIQLVNVAERLKKPIAMEMLDTTTSKASHPYGNKKANLRLSMFAYNKMTTAIKARAEKAGI
ncbi:transposase, partial [Aquibacillus sp. 3ASR75-11]